MPRGRRRTVKGRGVQALSAGTLSLSAMPGNPLLHFDARTGVTFDPSTERVSAWANLGSAGTAADVGQDTASEQPLYKATAFGTGKPAILYDGSDDLLWRQYSGLNIQNYTAIVGYAYSHGASNFHQAGIGGNSISNTETNSTGYFRGFGCQPVAPTHTKSFQLYNGNLDGIQIAQNMRESLNPSPTDTPFAVGGSWFWNGANNIVQASIEGSTITGATLTADADRPGTLQAFSVGRYVHGCLEGFMIRAITWPRVLSQVELNRATRVMKGGI